MPTVPFLGSYGDISGSGLMFRNKLINGGFDIWQRGTSQTNNGYGSDDRWVNADSGSTKVASRQTFTLGQTDVPGNPTYFARTVVTQAGSPAITDYIIKRQNIEGVKTLSGQMATLSFWAKCDSSKNISVEFSQSFGTGGSPSSQVNSIGVTTFAITSTWKYFTTTVLLPSVSGKTIGSNNDDYLQINMWLSAGSSYNARTNSLGQQSGTFDIANVQLEAGPQATPFEYRPIGTELALCQRYYQKLQPVHNIYFNATTDVLGALSLLAPMRAAPVTTFLGTIGNVVANRAGQTGSAATALLEADQFGSMSLRLRYTLASAGTTGQGSIIYYSGDAFLSISAEL